MERQPVGDSAKLLNLEGTGMVGVALFKGGLCPAVDLEKMDGRWMDEKSISTLKKELNKNQILKFIEEHKLISHL